MSALDTRMTATEKRLSGIAVQTSTKGGCVELDGLLICFGSAELKPHWPSNPHVREFKFEYPKSFDGIPAVTTGIDKTTGGNVYGVHMSSVTADVFKGHVFDNRSSPASGIDWNAQRVVMSYVAIGRAKSPASE